MKWLTDIYSLMPVDHRTDRPGCYRATWRQTRDSLRRRGLRIDSGTPSYCDDLGSSIDVRWRVSSVRQHSSLSGSSIYLDLELWPWPWPWPWPWRVLYCDDLGSSIDVRWRVSSVQQHSLRHWTLRALSLPWTCAMRSRMNGRRNNRINEWIKELGKNKWVN